MKFKLSGMPSAVAIILALLLASGAGAQNANALFNDGVKLYNAGKYSQALIRFEEVQRARGEDGLTHYYMALCCMATNQRTRASTEYQRAISTTTDPRIKALSTQGLASLQAYDRPGGRHGTTGTTGSSSSTATGSSSSTATGSSGSTSTSVSSAGSTGVARNQPRKANAAPVKKVIEFRTSWCEYCKEFAPAFEKAKSKFSKIQFEQLDGDDPVNAELKTKYNIKSYPTLVYLDGSGKVLQNESGAPTEKEFFATIEKMQ